MPDSEPRTPVSGHGVQPPKGMSASRFSTEPEMQGLVFVISAAAVAPGGSGVSAPPPAGRNSTFADMLSLSVPRYLLKSPVHAFLLTRIAHEGPNLDFSTGSAL